MKATTKSAIITSAVAPITAEEIEEEIAEVKEMSTDTIIEESLVEDIPQEETSSEDKKEESAE
jgi:Na+-translocating ferredoxin:NAD+ oxidoreductase RnfG subunit